MERVRISRGVAGFVLSVGFAKGSEAQWQTLPASLLGKEGKQSDLGMEVLEPATSRTAASWR